MEKHPVLDIAEFLKEKGPCLDVRSPKEFLHARIPGSINFPLFSDEERAIVGTIYKKEGKTQAIERGVEIVSPKLPNFLSEAKKLGPNFRIYCARGGMRSNFISWFLNFTGSKATQLKDGYKAFRRWSLEQLSKNYPFIVIGGFTGSKKTEILTALCKDGNDTLDLEKLANHRGSVFGGYPEGQPSLQQFENEIAIKLSEISSNQIWIEDESRMIGSCLIPQVIFNSMKEAPLIFIDSPKDERISYLVKLYGTISKEQLIKSVEKIQKRLGSELSKTAINHIKSNELSKACSILLDYYDRAYAHAVSIHKGPVIHLKAEPLVNMVATLKEAILDLQKNR